MKQGVDWRTVTLAGALAVVFVVAVIGTLVARSTSTATTAAPLAVALDAPVVSAPDAVPAGRDELPTDPAVENAKRVLAPLVRTSGLALPAWTPGGPAPSLTLESEGCTRRRLQALADRIAGDDAASGAVARAAFRWLTCTPTDSYDSIFIEMPPAGAHVPPDVRWGDYLATTPVGHRRGPESMWCFDTTGATGHAQCFAAPEACRARRTDLAPLIPDVTECALVDRLWCYPTRGTERRCAVERSDCEARRDRGGAERARCTARYPR